MKQDDIEPRLKTLENKVDNLSNVTLEIKEIKEMLRCLIATDKTSNPQALFDSIPRVTNIVDINPWALETTKNIAKTREARNWVSSARSDTYRKTLSALKSTSDWLSAEEVGELTGRERNTESAYLNRLYRARLIEQKTEGTKILYRIQDCETAKNIFGDF